MLTINSKVKEIIDNPEARDLVKSLWPGFDYDNPQMKTAYNLSLKFIISSPLSHVSKEDQAAVAKALEDAHIE